MSSIKKILLALFVVFIAIQFVPSVRNQNTQISSADIMGVVSMPENVKAVLKTSCYDCHSNNTNYPWYSKIQPVRWLQDKHVREGKESLNFSEFGTYSKRKQRNKLKAITNSIDDGSMPLTSYTLIHKKAKLNAQNKLVIRNWVIKAQNSLALNKN